MRARISPSVISGNVLVPPGKSMMQRICALALMNKGTVEIINPGYSNDDLTALKIIADCGALVKKMGGHLLIESDGIIRVPNQIQVGESGLSVRMFTPLLALSHQQFVVNGMGSLMNRPLTVLESILGTLGVEVKSTGAKLPLAVSGPMQVKSLVVNGSQSSQNLTGLLFAFCHGTQESVIIEVEHLVSKRYVDLSINLLRYFGYDITHHNYQQIIIHPFVKIKRDLSIAVESDWSSASFLLVAACIAGEVSLSGLDLDSVQADRQIMEAIASAGVKLNHENGLLTVYRTEKIHPFSFDATDCPDLFPPLAVLAAYAHGLSSIKGVYRLREKESDRGFALFTELKKMGVDIRIENDCMHIVGRGAVTGAEVDAHHDHRIAMAMAVAGLSAKGETIVAGAESVKKSFPAFFEVLKDLKADVNLLED